MPADPNEPPVWLDVPPETYRTALSSSRLGFYGFVTGTLAAVAAGVAFLHACDDQTLRLLWLATVVPLCLAMHCALGEINRQTCRTQVSRQSFDQLLVYAHKLQDRLKAYHPGETDDPDRPGDPEPADR